MRLCVPLLAVVVSGCQLAHMPADSDPAHLQVQWRSDLARALDDAGETARPILLCLVAGDLTESC
jgi:hypothetical protein